VRHRTLCRAALMTPAARRSRECVLRTTGVEGAKPPAFLHGSISRAVGMSRANTRRKAFFFCKKNNLPYFLINARNAAKLGGFTRAVPPAPRA
jgi:hypothetical protein